MHRPGHHHPVTTLRDGGHIGLRCMMYVNVRGPIRAASPSPRHPDAARIIRAHKLRQQPADPGSVDCPGFIFVAVNGALEITRRCCCAVTITPASEALASSVPTPRNRWGWRLPNEKRVQRASTLARRLARAAVHDAVRIGVALRRGG